MVAEEKIRPTSPEHKVTVYELLEHIYTHYNPDVQWFTPSDISWMAEQVVQEREAEEAWPLPQSQESVKEGKVVG